MEKNNGLEGEIVTQTGGEWGEEGGEEGARGLVHINLEWRQRGG